MSTTSVFSPCRHRRHQSTHVVCLTDESPSLPVLWNQRFPSTWTTKIKHGRTAESGFYFWTAITMFLWLNSVAMATKIFFMAVIYFCFCRSSFVDQRIQWRCFRTLYEDRWTGGQVLGLNYKTRTCQCQRKSPDLYRSHGAGGSTSAGGHAWWSPCGRL